ncbi:hypothetical protein G9A89_015667 [Geosiphon pyriformis]|nr:hypothetical protein G9A89_015667 [Geosiphon pyriformis]
MYTNTRVNGQSIKLIFNSGLAGSIVTRQLMDQLADRATKTPIGKIDNFPFKVNSIIISIKVLVIKATQYQALVSNDWLSKTNTELQLSQNGQQTYVPATCDYFKTTYTLAPLIELEEKKAKPIWEAY